MHGIINIKCEILVSSDVTLRRWISVSRRFISERNVVGVGVEEMRKNLDNTGPPNHRTLL